jgi:hypothetical protein|tara:strand:- start:1642 stop:1974 length:333 start_codon:yes stop_codon:yes gene_type:complete
MKKLLITVAIVNIVLWNALSSLAKADDYNTAVIGHVISETIKGTSIDNQAILESELQKLGHLYALEMVSVLQKYLPSILDSVMTDLRLQADKKYKCELLKDTKAVDKDCI